MTPKSFRLPTPLVQAIKAEAQANGTTETRVVIKALKEHFPSLAPVERAADSPVHPPASPTSLPPEDASPTVEVDRESSDALSRCPECHSPDVAAADLQAKINKLAQTMPRSTAERVARQMVRNA
mgnify:CR=1 FL=1